MEVILKKKSIIDGATFELRFKSYRIEGKNTWEFITCSGVESEAKEILEFVKEQGRYAELGFDSINGWFVRIKIED